MMQIIKFLLRKDLSDKWRNELPKYWFEYRNNQLQNRLNIIKDIREVTNYILAQQHAYPLIDKR